MNGPVLIPICSWFLTALSDFFNSLLDQAMPDGPAFFLTFVVVFLLIVDGLIAILSP